MQHVLELEDEEVAEVFIVTHFLRMEDYCSYMNIWSYASETASTFILPKSLRVTRNSEFFISMLLCLVRWYVDFCRSLLVNLVCVGVAHRRYRPDTQRKKLMS